MGNDECRMMNDELKRRRKSDYPINPAPVGNSSFIISHSSFKNGAVDARRAPKLE